MGYNFHKLYHVSSFFNGHLFICLCCNFTDHKVCHGHPNLNMGFTVGHFVQSPLLLPLPHLFPLSTFPSWKCNKENQNSFMN